MKRISQPHMAPPIGVPDKPTSIRQRLLRTHRQFALVRRCSLTAAVLVMLAGLYFTYQIRERHAVSALDGYRILSAVEQSASLLRNGLLLQEPELHEAREALWANTIWPAVHALADTGFTLEQHALLVQTLSELETKQRLADALAEDEPAALAAALERLESQRRQARALLESFSAAEAHHLRVHVQQLGAVVVVALLLLLLITFVHWLMLRHLARRLEYLVLEPLEGLEGAALQLAAGSLQEDLPVHSNDELGQLARALNQVRLSLAFAELKYRSLFAHTSNSMVLLSPEGFTITDVNRSFEILTGMKRRSLLRRSLLELFDEEQRDQLRDALFRALEKRQESLTALVMSTPSRLMIVLDVGISVIQISSEQVMEVSFKDMTEQYVKNQALTEIAFKDELTGLFNHRSFYQRLSEEIYQAKTQQHELVLLFVDLDNFKHCNDTFGHQVGDHLLRSVGRIILEHIRQDRDAGFRYGGDEFAILLPEAGVPVAQRIAEHLRSDFESIEQYGTSMSIGVAQWQEQMDIESFVKAADEALYAAKSAGKNTVCLYNPEGAPVPVEP